MSDLTAEMRGRWRDAFLDLVPDLEEAIRKSPKHVPCPVHGGKNGFRLYEDFNETGGGVCNTCGAKASGFAILYWLGVDQPYKLIRQWLTDTGISPIAAVRPAFVPAPATDWEKQKRSVLRHWQAAVPITEKTPAGRYLLSRGLSLDGIAGGDLRSHPGLDYWTETGKLGTYPALIGLVKKKGVVVGLHRIYLQPDGSGKAKLPGDLDPKKLLRCGEMSGGSLRLTEEPEGMGLMGVAEGIETGLAAHRLYRVPVRATISASMMKTVVLPKGLHSLIIFADKDPPRQHVKTQAILPPAGETAATALSARAIAEGVDVLVKLPPGPPLGLGDKGIDWNDVLLEKLKHKQAA